MGVDCQHLLLERIIGEKATFSPEKVAKMIYFAH
jgi:hypothetical protein